MTTQEKLNVTLYEISDVAKKFSRKELATVLVATTCFDETISQQYREFKTKENMVCYLMNWLDDCMEDTGEVEDLIDFINKNK